MKRLLISFLLVLLSSSILLAQDISPDVQIIHFSGTGSTYTNPDPLALPDEKIKSTYTNSLDETLEDAFTILGKPDAAGAAPFTNPILIGHSQGGMRAFAYASYLAMNGQPDATGVISVGGPLTGFTPLKGGFSVLTNRVRDVGQDLSRGVDAVISAAVGWSFPWPPVLSIEYFLLCSVLGFSQQVMDGLDVNYQGLGDPILDTVVMFLSGKMSPTIKSSLHVSPELIKGLTPDSTHIRKYITAIDIDVPAHYKKVRDGNQAKWSWTYFYLPFKIKFWYWKLTFIPKYKTVYVKTTYKTNPRLNQNTRVGYVTGTNMDLKRLMTNNDPNSASGKVYDDAKVVCNVAGGVMIAAGVINTAYAVVDGIAAGAAYASIIGIPLGIVLTAKAALEVYHAVNAVIASIVLLDTDKTIFERIFNTKASDGFVTADSTTLPLSISGGSGWLKDAVPTSMKIDVTHNELATDDSLWGTGGGIKNLTRDGYISKWILERNPSGSSIDNPQVAFDN